METIPTIQDITLPQPSTFTRMLVLPNMDPALHTSRSTSLTRTFVRHITHATTRLSILALKIVGIALAMLLSPRFIHMIVRCLDDMYEMIGRRARSPWETQTFWGNGVLAGLAVMFVLHDLLRRLSYKVILNEDMDDERAEHGPDGSRTWRGRNVTWERILMRLILPILLYGGLCLISWQIWQMKTDNKELVKANTVNVADDANAWLIWRDR